MEFVKYFNQNTIGNSHEDPKPNNFQCIDRTGEWFYLKSNVHTQEEHTTNIQTHGAGSLLTTWQYLLIRYYGTIRHGPLHPEPTAVSKSHKIRGSHSGVADDSKLLTCEIVVGRVITVNNRNYKF